MESPIGQLADALIAELTDRENPVPDRNILENLISVTFYCTLEKDEGQGIRFDLTYLDPFNPDPDPPNYIRSDRWIAVPFSEPLSFDKKSIAKVALASDHRTSLLLVYPDDTGTLKIWGFIDQGMNTYNMRNFESSEGFSYPGVFQLSAIEAGHLVARIKFEQIAELRGEKLTTKPLDVLTESAVADALNPVFDRLYRGAYKYVRKFEFYGDQDDLAFSLGDQALTSLRRLLLRIQGYGHGGAVLITPSIRRSQLNIKHRINYPRLAQAIQKTTVLDEHYTAIQFDLHELYDSAEEVMPILTHLTSAIVQDELEDAESELNGTLWFVSLLSRIDGLVLMDFSLNVRGFGVEILASKAPEKVWLAHDLAGSVPMREELPYGHYGTRHRSMMRYVSRVSGSIGFVVSQDGGVRAMTMLGPDLLVWDNIQLQLDFSIEKNKGAAELSKGKEDIS